MKIKFKCGNHYISVSSLKELPNHITYGGSDYLVGPDRKISKKQVYTCPVCHDKLWSEETVITQEQHKEETELHNLSF